MKYALAFIGIVVLLFFFCRRRSARKRAQRYLCQFESTRVFTPGTDPFDPKERIEFYSHRRGE
jgi:hypothetical protein